MKNNKGFTLIELLAVIIILAIVALVATPIVMNVIDDTKDSAAVSEANFVIGGIEKYCQTQSFMYNNPCPTSITKTEAEKAVDLGNVTFNSATFDPETGKVTVLDMVSNGRTCTLDEQKKVKCTK